MKFLLGISIILLSGFVYWKASGSLSLRKLNIISFSYYTLLFYQLIGGTIVFWGFRTQYLLQKVKSEEVFTDGYIFLIYTILMFGISIFLSNLFIFKTNVSKLYDDYIIEKTNINNSNRMFLFVLILGSICFGSMIYVCNQIGYIPLIELVRGELDFAKERIIINSNFAGNIYIKNLLFETCTPLLCYLAYCYMRVSKETKWKLLFCMLFLISVIAKTIDFSKSPAIYFIFYFFVIEVMLGNIKSSRKIIPLLVVCVVILLFFYRFIMGYEGALFSLTNGPMARLLISQVATFFLHIDAFPTLESFLKGASFNTKFAIVLENAAVIRSGRVVMNLYNPSGVKAGVAGVMNTFFAGEAYANWGILGIIIAPIIVGILFSVVHCYLLRLKKTPITITLYLEFFIIFTTILEGGFVDFFYNAGLIFIVLILLFLFTIGKIVLPKNRRYH